MSTRAAILTMLCLAGASLSCGEIEGGFLSPELEIRLSSLEGNEILQFVVLADRDKSGTDLTCADVTDQCIGDRPGLRIQTLETPSGPACAFREPLDADSAGTTDGQPISVPGIPPGTGYLLVVEVVRPVGRSEERVGVGCLPIERIVKGTNPPPSGAIDVRAASACLPSIDEC